MITRNGGHDIRDLFPKGHSRNQRPDPERDLDRAPSQEELAPNFPAEPQPKPSDFYIERSKLPWT